MSTYDFGRFSKTQDEEEKLQIQRDVSESLKEIAKYLKTISQEIIRFNDKVDIVDFLKERKGDEKEL